ncbi:MAG: hypothetical protein H8E03_01215 [Pelagibacteraceae bacterium]|nr:hypothetical protein [Pelagibacteraceae bacterium]
MGYLNNTTQVLDAILTTKGRELLAKGDGSFNITKFALGDDEIDYTLWNPAHASGSDYYGAVLENLPILEAVPNESSVMKFRILADTTHLQGSPDPTQMAYLTGIKDQVDNGISLEYNTTGNDGRGTRTSSTINPTTANMKSAEQYSFTLLNTNMAFLYLNGDETDSGGFSSESRRKFRSSQTIVTRNPGDYISIKAKAISSTISPAKTTLVVRGRTSGATASITVTNTYQTG